MKKDYEYMVSALFDKANRDDIKRVKDEIYEKYSSMIRSAKSTTDEIVNSDNFKIGNMNALKSLMSHMYNIYYVGEARRVKVVLENERLHETLKAVRDDLLQGKLETSVECVYDVVNKGKKNSIEHMDSIYPKSEVHTLLFRLREYGFIEIRDKEEITNYRKISLTTRGLDLLDLMDNLEEE